MSVTALLRPWPAPPFTRLGSWKGLSQPPVRGSGTQTVNCPFFAGMPSAPGYVPKNESNDLFSCMMITTCLILWMPVSAWAPAEPGGEEGAADGADEVQDATSEAAITKAAVHAARRIRPMTARMCCPADT